MRVQELRRDVALSAEVLGWVDWEGCLRSTAAKCCRTAADARERAEREESPCGAIRRIANASGVCAEEPEVRLRVTTHGAGEDDEELEEDSGGKEEPGEQSDD